MLPIALATFTVWIPTNSTSSFGGPSSDSISMTSCSGMELVQTRALAVRAGKPRDVTDIKAGVWATLNDGGVSMH